MTNQRRVRTPRTVYGATQPVRGRRRPVKRRLSVGMVPRRAVIIMVLLLGAGYGLKQLFTLNDVLITGPGASVQTRTVAGQALDAAWTQRNAVTFDEARLSRDMLKLDPSIKSAQASLRWPHGVSVKVALKLPSLGWTTGNQSYLLDHDGTIIGPLPTGQTLPVVIDQSNLPVQLGQRVASPQFVSFVKDISTTMASLKLGPTKLTVKDTTLDLYATTTPGYAILFDTTRPAIAEAADLQTILQALAAQKKQPAEYIDVRIVGKAYYK